MPRCCRRSRTASANPSRRRITPTISASDPKRRPRHPSANYVAISAPEGPLVREVLLQLRLKRLLALPLPPIAQRRPIEPQLVAESQFVNTPPGEQSPGMELSDSLLLRGGGFRRRC